MSVYLWPAPGYSKISSDYGMRNHPTKGTYTKHKGIDISTPTGSDIIAVTSGTVLYSQWSDDAGHWIMLKHKDGYYSRYLHLSVRKVQKGDKVEAGDVIAKSGNTGDSTGPHLHFEIRSSSTLSSSIDNSLDPKEYVSPDNSKIVTGSDSSSKDSNSTAPSYTIADVEKYKNLSVVGRRVTDTTDQPMHAFVRIWVGDKLLSEKPQYMQDFEITRYTGVGDTAKFTIFDDTWSHIEDTFAAGWGNVYIQYGYMGPEGKGVMSQKYHMQLTNYSLRYNSTGTFLTVSAIAVGTVEDNLKPVTIKTYTKNVGDAVRAICDKMGWTAQRIEKTITTYTEYDEEFTVLNTYPITYIKEVILKDGRARTGKGELLEFYLDANKNALLVPISFERLSSSNTDVRTYIHQRGYDSPIIDLEFDIKGVFGGTNGTASGLRTTTVDPYTKEEVTSEENITSVMTSATGNTIHMSSDQSIPSVNSAGLTGSQAKARLYYDVKERTVDQYEASMTIVGDPTIGLLDKVRVINVTDEGYLHHTSGIYMVKGIVDYVSGGQMTTTLSLVRNATGAMDEAMNKYGIEVVSPKTLVK